MEKKSKLAKRIEDLREQKDWTKTTVAKKLGIKTLSTYANWEYGIREPDIQMLIKIARLYDVSLDYLIGLSNNPNPENSRDEDSFIRAISDPELITWWQELPESTEEELRTLKEMWKLLNKKKD